MHSNNLLRMREALSKSPIERLDVLLARIAPGFAISSSLENIPF